jgi:hypothetical protein
MPSGEPVIACGITGCRNAGIGWEPMTLSTAIFSGNGISRERGGDNKVTNRIAPMYKRYGLTS